MNNHDRSSAALKVHLNRFSSLTGSENDSSEQMSKLKESVSLSSDKPMSQPVNNQANGRSVTPIFMVFRCLGDAHSSLCSALTGGATNCHEIKTFSSLWFFFLPSFFPDPAAQHRKSMIAATPGASFVSFITVVHHCIIVQRPGPSAQDASDLVQFVCLLQAERRTETDAQTGREVKEQLLGSRARSCWTLISFFLTPRPVVQE